MKKSLYLLVLSAFIFSSCSNPRADNNSSVSPSSVESSMSEPSSFEISSSSPLITSSIDIPSSVPVEDELSEEEKAVKAITDKIGNNLMAVTGVYRYSDRFVPDISHPEQVIIQNQETLGYYTSVVCEDYYFVREAYDDGRSFFMRYDHNNEGFTICKILDPTTNEREDRLVLNTIGQKVPFEQTFGNLFKGKDAYKAFALEGNKLVNKEVDENGESPYFNFERLGMRLMNRNMSAPFAKLEITLNNRQEPTNIYLRYSILGKITTTDFVYEGVFINERAANVSPIPSVHEHISEHEPLQAMLDNLNQNMNYTVDCHVGLNNGRYVDFRIYVNKTIFYLDFIDTYLTNSVSQGAYYAAGKGLINYQKSADGYQALGLPKTIRNVEQIFSNYWLYKAEMFSYGNDGYYTLYNDIAMYDNVLAILVPDAMGAYVSYLKQDSFKMKIDGNDLTYKYDFVEGSVTARVSNIGSTVLPFSISDITPYQVRSTMLDFINSNPPSRRDDYLKRLGLLTDNDVNILPYVDTPYAHASKIDCAGNVYIGDIFFTMNARFYFEFETMEECLKAAEDYLALLENNPDYEYDYELDSFIYHKGDVYIALTFATLENTQGFRYALGYNMANLNEAPEIVF